MAKSVLVIGGGPAGLSAARALGRLGVPTILVEKDGQLGGKSDLTSSTIRTFSSQGTALVFSDMVSLSIHRLELPSF